jgi:mannonate dehydratase
MVQAGVEGVVSALHHIPTGDIWQPDAIAQRQKEIATRSDGTPSGLTWDVVESLPVSEDIKKQSGDWQQHLENYRISMGNLAAAGIEIICYNFMPVLDWTRTDLAYTVAHGGKAMRFDLIDFAAFDIHILARDAAAADFTDAVVAQAKSRFETMSDERKAQLLNNVVCGLPGAAENFSLDDVRTHLAEYADIDAQTLRKHLVEFLKAVTPEADRLGMRLCCHPDDPPFSLMGLPRVMSSEEDYAYIIKAVDTPSNGITLCSGSLGVNPNIDLASMMDRLGDRVHFLHMRNVARETEDFPCSFHEAEHLGGATDMVALMKAVVREETKRRAAGRSDASIPFRPDHGQDILDDKTRKVQPGYPTIGRLKGLAELRGIMTALEHTDAREASGEAS